MPEKRKVYQYALHKKDFEFYGKEFMFVIFMKRVFYSTMLVFVEKPFFIMQLRIIALLFHGKLLLFYY